VLLQVGLQLHALLLAAGGEIWIGNVISPPRVSKQPGLGDAVYLAPTLCWASAWRMRMTVGAILHGWSMACCARAMKRVVRGRDKFRRVVSRVPWP
jgi:hypothetical protein